MLKGVKLESVDFKWSNLYVPNTLQPKIFGSNSKDSNPNG